MLISCLTDENAAYPTITAFQSATLRITFSFKKQPGKPQETAINASFTNLTTTTFTDFIFQAAVPKVIFTLDPLNLIWGNRALNKYLNVQSNYCLFSFTICSISVITRLIR
jgi:AP-1 complex subunit gamma-1